MWKVNVVGLGWKMKKDEKCLIHIPTRLKIFNLKSDTL